MLLSCGVRTYRGTGWCKAAVEDCEGWQESGWGHLIWTVSWKHILERAVPRLAPTWLSAEWESPCSLSLLLWGRVTFFFFFLIDATFTMSHSLPRHEILLGAHYSVGCRTPAVICVLYK